MAKLELSVAEFIRLAAIVRASGKRCPFPIACCSAGIFYYEVMR